MGDKIALGFHTCVDFELLWNLAALEEMMKRYHVRAKEISADLTIDSERALLLVCLAYLKEGIGGELVPEDAQICLDFSNHFSYAVTVGGTATRAAIAIRKIGYESAIQMCCFNRYIKALLPKGIHYFSSVGEGRGDIYPHVILSYPAGVHVRANDIDFVTPRENRVMFSRDIDSLNMQISQEFAPMIQDAEVFLLSCFSEVLDFEILKDRMTRTRTLLEKLPAEALVVMEDGCYIKKDYKYYVHEALKPVIDVLSMNEDELREYVGRSIDIRSPQEVLDAVRCVRERTGIATIVIHSAVWALAYGEKAGMMEHALRGGIAMASARFRYGDDFGTAEYEATKKLPDREEGVTFGRRIMELAKDRLLCMPCKDLSFVKKPTVVGLGDFFAGGMLPELVAERRTG